MLIVHHPEIEFLDNDVARLKAVYELDDVKKEMWYSTTHENAKYFCYERADAFIIPLLFLAMKKNSPVRIEAPISERLYYTINNYLQAMMIYIFADWKKVRLECPVTSTPVPNEGCVGTGLSCGIDSFNTILQHVSEKQTNGYRLTHCTFFNVGGHSPLWTDFEKTRELFQKRTNRVRQCAKELNMPIIVVDSNMEDILDRPFSATHTFRNASAVLALQKLFKSYYFSSGYPIFNYEFNPEFSCDYDIFTLPMLSTESLIFYPSGVVSTRMEKTRSVADFPVSYNFLNVCVYQNTNCSQCEKCMRTMFILDVLGKLHLYKNVFDLEMYEKNKSWFIGHVLACRKGHYKETYDPIADSGYDFGLKLPYYFAWYIHRIISKLSKDQEY